MNILFYQDTLGVSGGEIWIVDAATRLRERGHNVSFACPTGSWIERQAEHRGFPWADFASIPGFEGHHRWILAEHFTQHEIDVVFCSIPGMRAEVPLLDSIIRELGRGRIVIRLGVAPGPGAISPERVGVGCDSVSGLIAVSRDVRSHLLKNTPGLNPEKVHVIYNGVDLDRYKSGNDATSRDEFLGELGISPSQTVVAAIGRLDPIKNLPMLIDVSEEVVARIPDVAFLIAGDGAQRDMLEAQVRRRGLEDAFTFAGFVEDVPRMLGAVDVVSHTSRSEGVPNVLLEAMAAGKPIVATDVGGVRELIDSAGVGTLVPSGNVASLASKLSRILEQPSLRSTMGEAARMRVKEHFDRNSNIERIETVLDADADASGTARPPEPSRPNLYQAKSGFIARPSAA